MVMSLLAFIVLLQWQAGVRWVCHMKTKDVSERLLALRFMFPIVGTVLELGATWHL